MSETKRPYVAFISYSHRDSVWAAWIQKAIERYSLPGALAKSTGLDRRLGKVFRDREELSTGQNLGDHLLEALDNSDNLIVICSPNAVSSQWVGKEIEYFKSIGRGDRIFALLVEGGAEALPEPLLTDVNGNPLEPLAADPRDEGDGKRLAKLKLISGLLGVNLDQLTRREQARQNQLRAIYTGIASTVVVMAALAFVSYREQQIARQQEAFERETAMKNAANMVEFAKDISKQIDMESQTRVNTQLIDYLERSGSENLDRDTTRYLAQALQQLGMAQLEQSTDQTSVIDEETAQTAFSNFSRSRELYGLVLDSMPTDTNARFDVGIAAFYIGYTYLRTGQLEQAETPFQEYAARMDALYREDPQNVDFIFEYAASKQAIFNLRLKRESTFTPSLEADMTAAISAAEDAVAAVPSEPAMLDALSVVMNMGMLALGRDCLYQDPRIIEYAERAVMAAMEVFESQPRNREAKGVLAEMHSALAQNYAALNQTNDAREAFLDAYRLRVELADTDPSNQFYAAQVMKSRLDIQSLRTHDLNPNPETFTERQALLNLGSLEGRQQAIDAGLEAIWLLYFAEDSLLSDSGRDAAFNLVDDLTEQLDSLPVDEANQFVALRIITLGAHLDRLPKYSYSRIQNLTLPDGQDCRSRFTRRLWYSLTGDYDLAAQELAGIRERGVTYPAMDFYERLISQSENSENASGTFD
jgi:hypothetical protein